MPRAAAEYEAGRQAYRQKRYSDAGLHFEAAYVAVPRAEALRNAIRTRNMAKELDRAATLALIAERLYATDGPTMVLVHDVLAQANTRLGRIDVACTPACTLKIDGQTPALGDIPGAQHHVYVKPGTRSLEARFGAQAQATSVDVVAGGREEWNAQPPKEEEKPKAGGAGVNATAGAGTDLAPPSNGKEKPLSPVFFITGAVLSLGGIVTTALLYNNQRTLVAKYNAAYSVCGDDPTHCPSMTAVTAAKKNTYLVGGITLGVVAATAVVGLFFTRWTHADPPPPVHAGLRVEPFVTALPQGGAAGLTGAF